MVYLPIWGCDSAYLHNDTISFTVLRWNGLARFVNKPFASPLGIFLYIELSIYMSCLYSLVRSCPDRSIQIFVSCPSLLPSAAKTCFCCTSSHTRQLFSPISWYPSRVPKRCSITMNVVLVLWWRILSKLHAQLRIGQISSVSASF